MSKPQRYHPTALCSVLAVVVVWQFWIWGSTLIITLPVVVHSYPARKTNSIVLFGVQRRGNPLSLWQSQTRRRRSLTEEHEFGGVLFRLRSGAAAPVPDDDDTDDDDDDSDEEVAEKTTTRTTTTKKATEMDDENDEEEEEEEEDDDDEERELVEEEEEEEDDDEEEDEADDTKVMDTTTTKKNKKRASTTTTTKKKSTEVTTFDEPLVPSPFASIYVTFGVMMICRKVDLTSPLVIKITRIVYILYIVGLQLFLLYVRIKAKQNNDRTTITVNSPLSTALQGQLDSLAGGGAGSMMKTLASSFLSSSLTILEYDLKETKTMQRGLLVNMVFLWFLHFKMKQVQPIMIQTGSGLLNLFYSPLFQVYVLGRNLERPFKPASSQLAALQQQQEQEEEDQNSNDGEKASSQEIIEDDDDDEAESDDFAADVKEEEDDTNDDDDGDADDETADDDDADEDEE